MVFSLTGPGSTPSGALSPDFTMATIAPVILSTKAYTSSSLLPEIDVSLARMTCAIDRLFFSACCRNSFIVANGYFGGFFFGGVYPFHSMNPPPTE